MKFTVPIVLAAVLCGCSEPVAEESKPESPPHSAALPTASISLNNRGVGEMGAFNYGKAQNTFSKLVNKHPDSPIALANLAIATLNRQNPGDETAALEIIGRIEQLDSENAIAHYLSGILRFNAGEIGRAQEHFERVVALDPDDAYARYFLGQCQVQQGELASALDNFIAASEMDPYLRSAFYGAFLALQRSGKRDEARDYLEVYQRLEKNPRSRLAEIKYTKMGPKAMARPVRHAIESSDSAPNAATPVRWASRQLREIELAASPLSAGTLQINDAAVLLIPDEKGLITLDSETGEDVSLKITGIEDVLSIAVGDFNDDTYDDVYLGRDGEDQFWTLQDGVFDSWAVDLLSQTAAMTRQVLAVDADHDGDLDILRVADDGPILLNNNGDGSFRSLDLNARPRTAAIAVDVDADRDMDIVYDSGWLANDRMWDYQNVDRDFNGDSLIAADTDSDGLTEICALRAEIVTCEEFDGKAWAASATVPVFAGAREMALIDWQASGHWNLLVVGLDHWAVHDFSGTMLAEGDGAVLAAGTSDYEGSPVPALWISSGSGISRNRPMSSGYIALEFAGRTDEGQSMRSNTSGIGARYVLRTKDQWTAGFSGLGGSAPSSSPTPTVIGVRAPIEYLEIDWSDGVFQSELGLVAGEVHTIAETQRQLASCPVLFVYRDGEYRYVSDVLGVGGIGFATGFHTYATPRPYENFLLSSEQVDLTDAGRLSLYFTEPMEESAYLDAVSLQVIDVPTGSELSLDERMATDGRQPSGEPMIIRRLLQPSSMTNQNGSDVSEAASQIDQVAVDPPAPHHRFLGFLSSEHVLELEFEEDLSLLENPALIMDGWVEYGYSQTSFAAWQADLQLAPPTLERWDEAMGLWVSVREAFGYPAGMPRKSMLPLERFPAETRRLRLRTNQQIYFDRLGVADAVPYEGQAHRPILPTLANLQPVGFPRRIHHDQFRPDYDFTDRASFWDVNYQTGFYSAFGDVSELVTAADGALAIVGPGDGLRMDFDLQGFPDTPDGHTRYYLLSFDGWAKDRDLFTQTGETVAPIPGVRAPTAQQLHDALNTRFQSGR